MVTPSSLFTPWQFLWSNKRSDGEERQLDEEKAKGESDLSDDELYSTCCDVEPPLEVKQESKPLPSAEIKEAWKETELKECKELLLQLSSDLTHWLCPDKWERKFSFLQHTLDDLSPLLEKVLFKEEVQGLSSTEEQIGLLFIKAIQRYLTDYLKVLQSSAVQGAKERSFAVAEIEQGMWTLWKQQDPSWLGKAITEELIEEELFNRWLQLFEHAFKATELSKQIQRAAERNLLLTSSAAIVQLFLLLVSHPPNSAALLTRFLDGGLAAPPSQKPTVEGNYQNFLFSQQISQEITALLPSLVSISLFDCNSLLSNTLGWCLSALPTSLYDWLLALPLLNALDQSSRIPSRLSSIRLLSRLLYVPDEARSRRQLEPIALKWPSRSHKSDVEERSFRSALKAIHLQWRQQSSTAVASDTETLLSRCIDRWALLVDSYLLNKLFFFYLEKELYDASVITSSLSLAAKVTWNGTLRICKEYEPRTGEPPLCSTISSLSSTFARQTTLEQLQSQRKRKAGLNLFHKLAHHSLTQLLPQEIFFQPLKKRLSEALFAYLPHLVDQLAKASSEEASSVSDRQKFIELLVASMEGVSAFFTACKSASSATASKDFSEKMIEQLWLQWQQSHADSSNKTVRDVLKDRLQALSKQLLEIPATQTELNLLVPAMIQLLLLLLEALSSPWYLYEGLRRLLDEEIDFSSLKQEVAANTKNTREPPLKQEAAVVEAAEEVKKKFLELIEPTGLASMLVWIGDFSLPLLKWYRAQMNVGKDGSQVNLYELLDLLLFMEMADGTSRPRYLSTARSNPFSANEKTALAKQLQKKLVQGALLLEKPLVLSQADGSLEEACLRIVQLVFSFFDHPKLIQLFGLYFLEKADRPLVKILRFG